MAMTLGEAKVEAIKHINFYSNSGEVIDSSDPNYLDYVLRMNPLANTSQIELSKISKIPAKLTISQNPITNQLGLYAFDEIQHFPGTEYSYTATGSKSFSIEVDGDCVIYFDEYVSGVWTALNGTYSLDSATSTSLTGSITVSGISATTLQSFKNYRGLLTIASTTNTVRMKIVPTYPMKSRFRALYAYTFPNAVKAPHCMAFIPYDLPSDYMEFDRMMHQYDQRQFEENVDYKLTPDNKIHLNYFLTGQFDIHYNRFPTQITASTSDSYSFEVAEDAQSLIPWFMGGYAIYPTNQAIGTQLLNQYYELKDTLKSPKTNTVNTVSSSLWST